MKIKLTKSAVDNAKSKSQRYTIWDADLTGFGLRITPTGAKSYIVKYNTLGNRQRWYTIGKSTHITAKSARDEALQIISAARKGEDPQTEKVKSREAETVSQLCDLYLAHGCIGKKPSTIATDIGRIKRHIKPLLGSRIASEITSNDIKKFMGDVAKGKTATTIKTGFRGRARVTGGNGTAARTVGLLGGIFTFAIGEGIRPDNPVHGVKRFPDKRTERYLSLEELEKFGTALTFLENEGVNAIALNCIRLLALTGCRKGEILSLKWTEVDLVQGYLNLEDSKTGQKHVPLGDAAVALLKSITPHNNNPFVFPGEKPGAHFIGLPNVFRKVRAHAGLEDVTLHTLRHSFASIGVNDGAGLPIIGRLLGHQDTKTTSRYAHIADVPAKGAANSISDKISEAMEGSG